MRKIILSVSLLSITLAFSSAQAQVASRKGVTLDEVTAQLHFLFGKNDAESKELLLLEAQALVKSNKEQWAGLGVSLYQSLQKRDEAEKASKLIAKKFPKGSNARFKEYSTIFDELSSLSALEKEALHTKWLKKFPPNSFDEKDRNIYLEADAKLAVLFLKQNDLDKANGYIQKLKSHSNYPIYIIRIGRELISSDNPSLAASILEPAYKITLESVRASDKKVNQEALIRAYYNLAPIYATALIELDRTNDAVTVLEELFNKSARKTASNVELLSKAYIKIGRNIDAFVLMNDYLSNNESTEKLMKSISTLYLELNQNKEGNLKDYLSNLTAKSDEIMLAKVKPEMIKKKASDFSLLNMRGDTVSLANLKGKVVVLDFWATWCGPCKESFPGMQALVDKYKDDDEVEILFIDTWQREENYKELVQKFIADHQYTLNVLFDEMKNTSKSTATAYEVKGIPHKIVIDKEGFIRFESSGGSSNIFKVVSEMTAKIELAKRG